MTHGEASATRPEVISTCPVCASELAVTRLHCGSCGTSIEGDFRVGRFGQLSRDQMAVLESFLRSRGNLRDMERELGLSYPTVRSRVDAMVRALGFGDGGAPEQSPAGPIDPDQERGDSANKAAQDPAETESVRSRVSAERRLILERLAKHELSAADAAEEIRALGRAIR